ncbi:MAG: TonB-dependent receptor plug domain-containing protein [Leptothrix sp. (in: b-proteobacteria)]
MKLSRRTPPSMLGRVARKLPLFITVPLCAAPAAHADEAASFSLGRVEITGTRPRDDTSVDAQTMRRADADTVGAALVQVPGVVLSKVGARNEQMVQVRGFDLRQTPIFIDGVPVYVPYDGYVDLGRFNTFDLSRIQVEKGFSSMLYGANTLGGAINLIGRRPSKPLEAEAGVGLASDRKISGADARWAYTNLGLRQTQWYAQLSASAVSQDQYPLPASFRPTVAEDGGARNNSDQFDRKLSMKLGWLPRGDDEYTLNLIDQHGSKGTPPYAGNVASVAPRYWRWPYWDKQSVYAVSRTGLGEHVLKLRAFHDTFRNSLFTYDDASYTTQKKPSSFQSWYDDYSNGLSSQIDLALAQANTLGLAAHWKEDIHREHNAGEPVRHFKDDTTSVAAEDTQRFSPELRLITGVGHDSRHTQQAEDYNSKTGKISEFVHGDGSANNAQLALQQDFDPQWHGQVSLARKSRFPTIKDRYSYRLGTALPNADLLPERATHLELSLGGQATTWLHLQAAVFRSNIQNLIQSVTISTLCGSTACTQMQNIGQARAQGLELGGEAKLGAWQLDSHYQLLNRKNLSNPALKLTDTPRQQAMAHVGWRADSAWSLHAQLTGASSRYSSSDGVQVAGGYGVLDLKAAWQANPQVALEASVHNVGDRLYAYTEGFPEPGRQWLLQARVNW